MVFVSYLVFLNLLLLDFWVVGFSGFHAVFMLVGSVENFHLLLSSRTKNVKFLTELSNLIDANNISG